MAFWAMKKRYWYQNWMPDMIEIFRRQYHDERIKKKYGSRKEMVKQLIGASMLVHSMLNNK